LSTKKRSYLKIALSKRLLYVNYNNRLGLINPPKKIRGSPQRKEKRDGRNQHIQTTDKTGAVHSTLLKEKNPHFSKLGTNRLEGP
jgi:hypothetical protein